VTKSLTFQQHKLESYLQKIIFTLVCYLTFRLGVTLSVRYHKVLHWRLNKAKKCCNIKHSSLFECKVRDIEGRSIASTPKRFRRFSASTSATTGVALASRNVARGNCETLLPLQSVLKTSKFNFSINVLNISYFQSGPFSDI
jgi:hypothetical protein